jgi:hypothetical protein
VYRHGVQVYRHGVPVYRHGVPVYRHDVPVYRHGVQVHRFCGHGVCFKHASDGFFRISPVWKNRIAWFRRVLFASFLFNFPPISSKTPLNRAGSPVSGAEGGFRGGALFPRPRRRPDQSPYGSIPPHLL